MIEKKERWPTKRDVKLISIGALIVSVLIAGIMWGWPKYNVWKKALDGEADLRRAEQDRKIVIEEAKANLESSKLLREAEIERAHGVAEANAIIGDSLEGKEEYLRYLWIMGLQDGSSEVIYIPTEAGLPILEAGRRP